MLFAFLQVSIFSVVAFFVMGTRGKMWEPRLFLAIPIVLCLFSYLYAISVLLGVITRSTIATLLLTVLLWAIIGGMHFSEVRLQALRNIYAAAHRDDRSGSGGDGRSTTDIARIPKRRVFVDGEIDAGHARHSLADVRAISRA